MRLQTSFFILFPIVALATMTLLRLPWFYLADGMHSDHMLVGLQALHLLKGEWSWFLWGCDYQASFEPLLAAGLFSVFGASSQAIVAVALLAMGSVVLLQWVTLSRIVGVIGASALVSPLVWSARAFVDTTVLPPRQWCYVAVYLAALLLVPSENRKRSPRAYRTHVFCAGFLAFFAMYLDFYAIVFLLPLLFLVFRFAYDRRAPLGAQRALLAGLLLGGGLLLVSRFLGPKSGAPLAFNVARIPKNWALFWDACLPGIYASCYGGGLTLLPKGISGAKSVFYVVRVLLAYTTLALLALSAFRILTKRHSLSPAGRYLSEFGLLVIAQTTLGFLGSSMASDGGSARYLVALILGLPFALIPVASRWVCAMVFVFALTLGAETWMESVPGHHGLLPAVNREEAAREDKALQIEMLEQGIKIVVSDYWTAYRLSFLFRESPRFVPRDPGEDRYPPYRQLLVCESRIAYLAAPRERDDVFTPFLKEAEQRGWAVRRFRTGGYRWLVVDRPK